MCYKKWQSFRSSIFKAILHERKAIFPTKQTYITKQMQWYFYILRKKRKCYFKFKSGMIFILLSILEKYWPYIKINSKHINGGGGNNHKIFHNTENENRPRLTFISQNAPNMLLSWVDISWVYKKKSKYN